MRSPAPSSLLRAMKMSSSNVPVNWSMPGVSSVCVPIELPLTVIVSVLCELLPAGSVTS